MLDRKILCNTMAISSFDKKVDRFPGIERREP